MRASKTRNFSGICLNFGVMWTFHAFRGISQISEFRCFSEIDGFETFLAFSGNEFFGIVVEVCGFFNTERRKRVRR